MDKNEMGEERKINPWDEYNERVVVGAVDVIGIRNIVEMGNSNESVDILSVLYRNCIEGALYGDPTFTKPPKERIFAISEGFGDSLYLFGNPKEEPKVQADKMIPFIGGLIAYGFMIFKIRKLRCRLRVGIAVGEVFHRGIIYKDPFTGEKLIKNIRMGKALIDAHNIEECQSWIGGAVSEEVKKICDSGNEYLIDYKIPTSTTERYSTLRWAINWVNFFRELTLERKIIEDIFTGGTEDDIEEKKKNTLAFFDHAETIRK